ncbi:MAG: fumarylacetoacetate hydrolase family protein, partial [Pusillimonas sp.]
DMALCDGEEIAAGRLIQPKVEAEIALVLERDLPHEKNTLADLIRATAYLLPALEVVDSRIAGWDISLADTIADNASSGVYVLGLEPRKLGQVDLLSCGMDFRKNGVTESVGSGAACLGHPLLAAHWLARTMFQLGSPLKAGDVILSGALGPMFPLAQNDQLNLSISGLGSVMCRIDA